MGKDKIKWLDEPEQHDYPAAESYLTLIFHGGDVSSIVEKLEHQAFIVKFKAKDIFRASGLPLLGLSNDHIESNKDKIKDGKPLSPLLLVRDETNRKVIVADGYHRLCAVYQFDEDAMIPCKII